MANVILSCEPGILADIKIEEEEIKLAVRYMLKAFKDSIPREMQTLEVLDQTLEAIRKACHEEVPLDLDAVFSNLL